MQHPPSSPSRRRSGRVVARAACALAALVALAARAIADEVTVRGDVIRGRIASIGPAGVEIDTDYGSGRVRIAWKDIEAIATDGPRLVFYGATDEVLGRILGLDDGAILIAGPGPDPATPRIVRVAFADIVRVTTPDRAAKPFERLRDTWRFWSGSVDAGMVYEQDTDEELDLNVAYRFERRRSPTRWVHTGRYIFGIEHDEDEDSETTDNELHGHVKLEVDFDPKTFFYTSHDAEHNAIDRRSLLYVAQLGAGRRIIDTSIYRWQVETGIAYTYDRFYGGEDGEYIGIPFATEGSIQLAGGSKLDFRVYYLPALDDWADDYIIRSESSLSIPLTNYLAFKTSVIDSYDSTPDEDASKNEIRVIMGLSWRF